MKLPIVPQANLTCLLWPFRLFTHTSAENYSIVLYLCLYAPLAWAFLKARTICFYPHLRCQCVIYHTVDASRPVLVAWMSMQVFEEDPPPILAIFWSACSAGERVWDATTLWARGQCRDLATFPRNVFLLHCTQDTVPLLGNPGAKYTVDTEVSLPHRILEHSIDLGMHKKHRSRQHNIPGPVMGMTFINSQIIQPFPYLWFLTRPLSGLIFLLWVFAVYWYLSRF